MLILSKLRSIIGSTSIICIRRLCHHHNQRLVLRSRCISFDGFNLALLRSLLLDQQSSFPEYKLIDIEGERNRVLCITSNKDEYPIFVFDFGCIVDFYKKSIFKTAGVAEDILLAGPIDLNNKKLQYLITQAQIGTTYDHDIIANESEELLMRLTNCIDGNATTSNKPMFNYDKSTIILPSNAITQADLGCTLYPFADAIACSVRLALWEHDLIFQINSILASCTDLTGAQTSTLTLLDFNRKLLTVKHRLNLKPGLCDASDFYWDREHSERLLDELFRYFNIRSRVRVANMKINHCLDLIKLIQSAKQDTKHTRLEFCIIALILIEVCLAMYEFQKK